MYFLIFSFINTKVQKLFVIIIQNVSKIKFYCKKHLIRKSYVNFDFSPSPLQMRMSVSLHSMRVINVTKTLFKLSYRRSFLLVSISNQCKPLIKSPHYFLIFATKKSKAKQNTSPSRISKHFL